MCANISYSRGRGQPEGVSGRVRDQQGQDATYTSNQARSRPQLLSLLLRDPEFARQGLSVGQTGT